MMDVLISDTRYANPSFDLMCSYTPNEETQPFEVYFNNKNNYILLGKDAQSVITNSDKNDVETKSLFKREFKQDEGLLIKANNHVKAATYSGVVDWTLGSKL
ncbi:hypothetical protein [Fructobacillus parabroussonetiae]|uniref:Uncharacterized protein n=1 Tax=Fructobacillus parabroussonetiae TaxID=2713174 RepID=A0ABS5QYR1_9LACO|nr:hypothetical protein [Fructobacillus parabroussonetiae]MBS9337516.1 hypothetical protein [Fructobacillus parabroussonetiae]